MSTPAIRSDWRWRLSCAAQREHRGHPPPLPLIQLSDRRTRSARNSSRRSMYFSRSTTRTALCQTTRARLLADQCFRSSRADMICATPRPCQRRQEGGEGRQGESRRRVARCGDAIRGGRRETRRARYAGRCGGSGRRGCGGNTPPCDGGVRTESRFGKGKGNAGEWREGGRVRRICLTRCV